MSDDVQQVEEMRLSVRMTHEEMQKLERLRDAMQKRIKASQYGHYVRVTQKTVILEALDALEKRLQDLDRDRRKGSSQ